MTLELGLSATQGLTNRGTGRQTQAEHERRTTSLGSAAWFGGDAASGAGTYHSWPASTSGNEITRDIRLGSFVSPLWPDRTRLGTLQDLGGWPLRLAADNPPNAEAEKLVSEHTTLHRQTSFAEAGQTLRTSAIATVRNLLRKEQITAARRLLDLLPADVLDDPATRRLQRALTAPVVRVSEHRDVERRDEYEWLRRHAGEYRGQWVALAGERLVASAPSLRELRARLPVEAADRQPLIHRL